MWVCASVLAPRANETGTGGAGLVPEPRSFTVTNESDKNMSSNNPNEIPCPPILPGAPLPTARTAHKQGGLGSIAAMNAEAATLKHSHYKKDVSHLKMIDVYRVMALYNVTDSAIAHAIKKLLVSGGRGVKGKEQDYREAIDSIVRALDMMEEDKAGEAPVLLADTLNPMHNNYGKQPS